MRKIKINKEDKSRILLTELLPYEVPMLFSNEGFYSIVQNNNYAYYFQKIKTNWEKKYALPFNYKIKKNIYGETRTLSIIHPFIQQHYIELFEKYDSLMLHLCSKSPFSLRKIHKIAKFYFSPNFVFEEESILNPGKEVEPDILDSETKYIKSYFTYKPIDLIYKFYDRNEFQRLEQRFNFMMEFDISKCFYHIYTHSITWAVKDKESAKLNSNKKTFENDFDKLMQLSNYNETNGILVGPEISRIFAEIILQQVDLNVLEEINSTKYKLGVDYEIRRYVDDYFIFSNNTELLELIKNSFKKNLQFYKLYLNPNKSEVKTSPFISEIAVGKAELRKELVDFYNNLFEKTNKDGEEIEAIKKINKPYVVSKKFIKEFQVIVKRNNLTYDSLSKDVVRFIKSKLVSIFKNEDKLSEERSENFLLTMIDILFYCYSVNINTNTTFRISQVIVLITKYFENKTIENIKHSIFSKIFRDSEFALTNFHRKQRKNDTSIETLNLLIALNKLGQEYKFSEKKISEFFNLGDIENLNYFQIITLLYYFNNSIDYKIIQEKIILECVKRFSKEKAFLNSELTLLFFDLVNCPFLEKNIKRKILRKSKYVSKQTSNLDVDSEIDKIINEKKWFMDWNQDIDLERVLKKKEWVSSY